MTTERDFERVEVFRTRVDAEAARSALEAHGIAATVAADDGGGTGIAMSLYHQGVELRVARSDRSEAREVLGIEHGGSTADTVVSRSGPPWQVVALVALFVGIALVQLLAG